MKPQIIFEILNITSIVKFLSPERKVNEEGGLNYFIEKTIEKTSTQFMKNEVLESKFIVHKISSLLP